MNTFYADLSYSMTKVDFWKAVYKKAFPIMLYVEDKSHDRDAQTKGIDVVIHLPFGGRLFIDEKLRRKDYGDILIEYVSNDQKKTKGWIEKELKIDFIAYAFEQSRTVYFLPFVELQKLWTENKELWLEKYKPPKVADNKFYKTFSLAIPMSELKSLRIIKVSL